jgi:beta-glucosidase
MISMVVPLPNSLFNSIFAPKRSAACFTMVRRVKAGESLTAAVTVKNTGHRKADEVVQLYLTDDEASTATLRCALKAFRRVSIAPGRSKRVKFQITPRMMELIGDDGEARLEGGTFTVTVGGCSPGGRGEQLGAPSPATGRFQII